MHPNGGFTKFFTLGHTKTSPQTFPQPAVLWWVHSKAPYPEARYSDLHSRMLFLLFGMGFTVGK